MVNEMTKYEYEIAERLKGIDIPGYMARESWILARNEILARAKCVTRVASDSELEIAGAVEADAKRCIKRLEYVRRDVTRPLDNLKKEIMAKEREIRGPLEDEQRRINGMTTAYATEQARKAEEERAARERAEREAAEAAEAAREKAEEEARRAAEAAEAFGIKDEPPPAEAPLPPNPFPLPEVTTRQPRTSSNRFVERWEFDIVDRDEVPRELCSPDPAKIRALLNAKKAEGYKADQIQIKGIRVKAEIKVYSK